jgi:predicted dehydrogenase
MLRVELPKWVYELPAALIYDEGVHMAYLVSAFLKNVKVVRALFRKFHELPTHLPYDYFESTLENDEGALASIRGFYSAPRTEWMMSIVGTKKILIIDNLRDTLITMGYRKFSPCAFALSGVRSLYQQGVGMSSRAIRYILKRDSHRVIISRFVSSILEDKPPPITAYEGKRAVEIMDNIMRFL